ncbi:MAG: anti-sigma factor [Bacteroidota bacterium]|nr:anti-sigma factor [Bacteroidota bacterium]
MNHDDKYLRLCGVYALGALDGSDQKNFEAHIQSRCEICGTELAKFTEISDVLYKSLPQFHVQPELRERILFSARLAKVVKSSIQKTGEEPIVLPTVETPPQKAKSQWFVLILLVAVLIMILGFTMYIKSLLNKMDEQREFQNTQQSLLTKYADKLEQQNAIVQLLKSYPLEIIKLDGSLSYSNCSGKIIWNPVNKVGVLQTSNLPTIPDENVYQLWMIKDEKPIDILTFSVSDDSTDENIFLILSKELGEKNQIEEFIITRETRKGAIIPSGELVISVKLNP